MDGKEKNRGVTVLDENASSEEMDGKEKNRGVTVCMCVYLYNLQQKLTRQKLTRQMWMWREMV